MFELDGDLELDDDFLEDVFQSAGDVERKEDPVREKRSSPSDVISSSPKKQRIVIDENEIRNGDSVGSNARQKSPDLARLSFHASPVTSKDCIGLSIQRPIRRRKFPGPAGLLLEKDEMVSHSSSSPALNTAIGDEGMPICSQSSVSMFELSQWLQMSKDYNLSDPSVSLRQFTVAWMKRRAAAKKLSDHKIPYLAAVLHEIDCSSPDPCVKLRDPTGEIRGTLHREVWEQYGGLLVPGTVLVLRQVGVLSTGMSSRCHYLNMTLNNILRIYSGSENGELKRTVVHNMTQNELLQSVLDWQSQTTHTVSPWTPESTPSLFSKVGNEALRETTNFCSNNTFSDRHTPQRSSTPLNRVSESATSWRSPSLQRGNLGDTAKLSPISRPNLSGSSSFGVQPVQKSNVAVNSSPSLFTKTALNIVQSQQKTNTITNLSQSPCNKSITDTISNRISSQQNTNTWITNSSCSISGTKYNSQSVSSNPSTLSQTGGFKPKVPVFGTSTNVKPSSSLSIPSTSSMPQEELDVLEGLDASILFDDF